MEPSDDPTRIVTLTAHAVARFADRFPTLRKWSRHMEGNGNKAGILSDVGVALYELYKRNPEAIETLGRQFVTDLQHKRAEANARANGGATPPVFRRQPQPTQESPHAA